MIKERFVDYLFELRDGKIPDAVKPYIRKIDGNIVYVEGEYGGFKFKTALVLGGEPYDSNLPCLGMLLFGVSFPHVLKGIENIIRRRI